MKVLARITASHNFNFILMACFCVLVWSFILSHRAKCVSSHITFTLPEIEHSQFSLWTDLMCFFTSACETCYQHFLIKHYYRNHHTQTTGNSNFRENKNELAWKSVTKHTHCSYSCNYKTQLKCKRKALYLPRMHNLQTNAHWNHFQEQWCEIFVLNAVQEARQNYPKKFKSWVTQTVLGKQSASIYLRAHPKYIFLPSLVGDTGLFKSAWWFTERNQQQNDPSISIVWTVCKIHQD